MLENLSPNLSPSRREALNGLYGNGVDYDGLEG